MNKKEAQRLVDKLANIKDVLNEEHKKTIIIINKLQTEFLDITNPIEKGYVRIRTSNGFFLFKPMKYRSKLRKKIKELEGKE